MGILGIAISNSMTVPYLEDSSRCMALAEDVIARSIWKTVCERSHREMTKREEQVREARSLKDQGFIGREISEVLGVSKSTTYELLSDPDSAKRKERRLRNGGVCVDCGVRTTEGNRKRPAKRCKKHAQEELARLNKKRGAEKRAKVESLWAQGLSQKEIRAVVGRNLNFTTLRKNGYNLPYRRSLAAVEKFKKNASTERMAIARMARVQNGFLNIAIGEHGEGKHYAMWPVDQIDHILMEETEPPRHKQKQKQKRS